MPPKLIPFALPVLLLAACTSGDAPDPKAPQKNAFDSLTQTEQRAREVQGTVDSAAARTRAGAEAEERGEPAR